MRYPNLTAEFETASGTDIKILSDEANVTEEIMHDVLYGDEELSADEAFAVYRGLSWCDDPNGGLSRYSLQYLFAPKLATLNPRKPKTRHRYLFLKDKYLQARKVEPYTNSWAFKPVLENARLVLHDMGRRKPVRYADYRRAVTTLDNYIAFYSEQQRERERKPRSRRLEADHDFD